MPRLRHRTRPAVWVALSFALLVVINAAAQPPRVEEAGNKLPVETTLYLVLRTGPDEDPKEIETILKDNITKVGATIKDAPRVVPISPAFVEEFENLLGQASAPVVSTPKEGPSILPIPSRELMYELVFPATQVVTELSVKYKGKDGGKDRTEKYVPAKFGEKGALVPTTPGRYAFTPDATGTPLSFEGKVTELGKPEGAVKGEWPRSDRFYVVTLRGFSGDKQALFDRVGNGDLLANPIQIAPLSGDLTFAFARLNSTLGKTPDTGIHPDNSIDVRVNTIPDRNPKRVWVLFPLKKDEVADALKKLDGKKGAEMADAIRADKTEVAAAVKATIGPDDAARWFELPPVAANPPANPPVKPTEFMRNIRLTNLPELAKKYPSASMLVVWEFDDGTPAAIQIEHPVTKGRVFVIERERAWANSLQQAIQKNAPPPK